VSVFIIAEAGVNHNGSIELAFKLVDAAIEAGVDAVKFQTYKSENLVSKNTQKAEYQKKTTNSSESQLEMLKKLELSFDAYREINNYCQDKNIIFLSTPFDHSSINLLYELNLKFFKIPSGEITNLPYLRHIGSLAKQVILSTGMSTLKEVGDALAILIDSGTKKENITVLHANTMYPTPMEDVNLRAMQTIQKEFDVSVGYSDHTMGIEVSIAAIAMGASIIEKHFTLDKTMRGPDHIASLEPKELKAMVTAIRNIEKAVGKKIKTVSPSELENKNIVRKSITAKCSIKKGERLTEDNLIIKRPGTGISPMNWDKILGTVAKNDYQADELI
jgi:N,N'-diacetyllegionaminate synthase